MLEFCNSTEPEARTVVLPHCRGATRNKEREGETLTRQCQFTQQLATEFGRMLEKQESGRNGALVCDIRGRSSAVIGSKHTQASPMVRLQSAGTSQKHRPALKLDVDAINTRPKRKETYSSRLAEARAAVRWLLTRRLCECLPHRATARARLIMAPL